MPNKRVSVTMHFNQSWVISPSHTSIKFYMQFECLFLYYILGCLKRGKIRNAITSTIEDLKCDQTEKEMEMYRLEESVYTISSNNG